MVDDPSRKWLLSLLLLLLLRRGRIPMIDDPPETLQLFVSSRNLFVKTENLLLQICHFRNMGFCDFEHVSSQFIVLMVPGFESLPELRCRSSFDVKVYFRDVRRGRGQGCRNINCWMGECGRKRGITNG